MKVTVNKPTEINVKYLDVYPGDRVYAEDIYVSGCEFDSFEELFEKYPSLEKDGELYLRINIDNGVVENWPKGIKGDFETVKVVDEGTYELFDEEEHLIHHYEGYVPHILEIDRDGYGDYFEFCIDKSAHISNWHCDDELIQEMLEEY